MNASNQSISLRSTLGLLALPLALIAIQTACSKDNDSGGSPPVVQDTVAKPLISVEPQNKDVKADERVSFVVVASGSELKYQWRKNGLDIAGAVSAEYVIEKAASADSGSNFTVKVSNAGGEIVSKPAFLTVAEDVISAPSITSQPQDKDVLALGKAIFSVVASGSDLKYQWKKNGLDITGAVGSEYVIEKAALEDSGSNFMVKVSNAGGEAISKPAFLRVAEVPTAPAIVKQPADVAVVAPAPATFAVELTGTAPITYQWYRTGEPIVGANAATYILPATTDADEGSRFFVIAQNAKGTVISKPAKLTVQALAPVFKTQPAPVTAAIGQTATFTAEVIGSAPLAYQWMRNGVKIEDATAASYTTPVLSAADDGANFMVLVGNSLGSLLSDPAKLTVTDQSLPVIATDPADAKVLAPAPATFSVVASGPSLSYQWKRNGLDIEGATAASYTLPVTAAADSGSNFMVIVRNAFGQVFSKNAILTVEATPITAPVISTFMALPEKIATGQSSTLFWAASNANSLELDQALGVVTGNSLVVKPGATTTYTLKATNASGSVTATVTVTVDDSVLVTPVIDEFIATPASGAWGSKSTLTWKVRNATSLKIDQNVGDVTGKTSASITIYGDKEYILTASNDKGSVVARVKVTKL